MSESYSFRWGLPKEYQWTDIPNFILFNYAELGVTNVQMMLIVHLATFYHDTEESEGSHPSTQTIADRMGVAYATAFENLKALEANGWVIINRRPGYPSIYDFSPLTNACLELQQSKPITGGSQENLRGRVSGKSETGGSQENLRRKEESSKQELQNENPPPLDSLGPKTQPQPEPTPSTTNAPKATGQSIQEASSAQAISKHPWPPHFDSLPHGLKITAPLKRTLPHDWTDMHIFIYLHYLGKQATTPATKADLERTKGIYEAFTEQLKEAPLTPATIADFKKWYYEQEWVLREAGRKGKLSNPQEAIGLPYDKNKLSRQLDDFFLAHRLPAYTPREHTAPPKRGNVFSRGGGV